jgi:hypothetical protein
LFITKQGDFQITSVSSQKSRGVAQALDQLVASLVAFGGIGYDEKAEALGFGRGEKVGNSWLDSVNRDEQAALK